MSNVVVLTFHTVMDHDRDRPWAFLSTSVRAFENTLKYLKKHHYQTITLKELYDWKEKGKEDDIKRVLIHFDDGFLDNYTIAYPLLKKYGFKASVFVSPDFVDPRPIIRETQYENIMRGCPVDQSNVWGYMSWDELRKIDSEGIIDVQAHAMTHTWYPCEAKLIDWHHPNDSYYWLVWNEYPHTKPYWLTQYDETMVPYGYPVFKYAKSLSGKRFFPRREVVDFAIEFYDKHNVECQRTNRQQVISQFNALLTERFHGDVGAFETDDEFKDRVYIELVKSKKIIETKLNKRVEFLVWPGGAVSSMALEIAREAGYLAWSKKGKPYNELHDALCDVYRLGGWSGIRIKNRPVALVEHLFLKMQLNRAKGTASFSNRIYAVIGSLHRKRHIRQCRRKGENWK